MKDPNYWVICTKLDTYEVCANKKRIGASAATRVKFTRIEPGDFGVFYISTAALDKPSQMIAEFRGPFVVAGRIQSVAIPLLNVPKDKQLVCSASIKPIKTSARCSVRKLLDKLEFIKKKECWGSYLMQSFIRVSEKDFQTIKDGLEMRKG